MPFPRSAPLHTRYILPLVRLMVSPVFLFEGLQKFLYPSIRGAGRFESIGFPAPELLGYLVGSVETACGLLILLGLFTRFAALPTAVITTKIPVLLGHDFGPFGVRDAPFYGFLSMVHEMRTDWAMLLGSIILILGGAGAWSLDAWRAQADDEPSAPPPGTSGRPG